VVRPGRSGHEIPVAHDTGIDCKREHGDDDVGGSITIPPDDKAAYDRIDQSRQPRRGATISGW